MLGYVFYIIHGHVIGDLPINQSKERLYRIKRLLICHIVCNGDSMSFLEILREEWEELWISRSVPDLQSTCVSIDCYVLRVEVDSICLLVRFVEFVMLK